MKKGKNFLRMLVLAGIITSLGFMQFGYAQPVKRPSLNHKGLLGK